MSVADDLVGSISLDRDHQMRAVRAALEALLVDGRQGIVLADEVGCGKTYEALATVALLWRHFQDTPKPIRRVLVVAEPALMHKWFDEIEATPDKKRGFQQYVQGDQWGGFLSLLRNVTQLGRRGDGNRGGVRENGKLQVPDGRVYVVKPLLLVDGQTSQASPMVRWLRSTDWDAVIVDEAHHFTSLNTERSRVFFPNQTPESRELGLSARYTLALTATPFQLAMRELLNLFRITRAPEDYLTLLSDGLKRYETALSAFYARRGLNPDDDGRRRWVERLCRLRTVNASDEQLPGTPGLEQLLRRYLIRNVKPTGERDYALVEQRAASYTERRFEKLDDLRPIVARSPLIAFDGHAAWIYLQLRDLIKDADRAARELDGHKQCFIAGDLRQCLSSYEQLGASAILQKSLPQAEKMRGLVHHARDNDLSHPKVRALCSVVKGFVEADIDAIRSGRSHAFSKILVFNTLMHTAGALQTALLRTASDLVEPFVDEQIALAGWSGRDGAKEMVRTALHLEREQARESLKATFHHDHLKITPELLDGTSIAMTAESREIVDVMFDRAENHCTQPLFLLRIATWLRALQTQAETDHVRNFVMKHVGDRLYRSISKIVDDFLDDTPQQGEAFSDENHERARREIGRLGHILAAPEVVARFDGRQADQNREMRRENFNRPYAPLVLLVSKVGEEGIDLQAHTRHILHYDVEWNPGKMEQREGRVDREGRKTRGPIQVGFLLLKDTYEERVFHTVMQRDAWFQILIGSKRQELSKGMDDDPEVAADADMGELENGRLTAAEREKVMINLRP